MGSPAGAGPLYQGLDAVFHTDLSQGIHLLLPGVIRIGKVGIFGILLVVVKVEDQKVTGIIGQKRIHADYFVALEMGLNVISHQSGR